jgi:protein-tyrosine phosphatase
VTDGTDKPYTILCVCTGNVCRSPAAELLLAARLGPSVKVASAGTLGLVGRPIEPPMAAHLAALGLEPVGFTARRLTAADVAGADLVLGLTRGHRAEAVELAPAAVRRAFTLLEFARLLGQIRADELPDASVADRLRTAVPLAAARRRLVVGPMAADDVVDPYRMARQVYEQSFSAIRAAVDTIADRLHPQVGHSSGVLRRQLPNGC